MSRLALILVVVGCGGGDGDRVAPDASRAVDAANPPDAPAGVQRIGRLMLVEYVSPVVLTSEVGAFTEVTQTKTERIDGACTIRTGTEIGTNTNIGTINIRSANGSELMLTADAMNEYGAVQQGTYFPAGLPVAISNSTITGGAAAVTFPTALALDPPPPFAKTGYALAWAGPARVRVLIAQTGTGVTIECEYTGSGATIPASTLSDLVPGTTNDKQIAIVIGGVDENQLTAGGWSTKIVALKAAYNTITFVQ